MSYFHQESERLRFRKVTREDIPTWMEFFVDNDHLRFMGMDLTKSHKTLSTEWIEAQLKRYEKSGLGNLAVEDKETGQLIGLAGIIPRELDGKSEYEIGYSTMPKYWRQGYGTEIARSLKAYGIKNVSAHRFISIIEVENHGSAKVAMNNGMSILFQTEFMGMNVNVYGVEVENQIIG